MSSLQIYILSRDRPDYLKLTILSALKQVTNQKYEVIVSDNSEEDHVEKLVAEQFKTVKYIRRKPTLSAHDHFNKVITESDADYVVYFHDDDVLLQNYVQVMVEALNKNPSAAAVACNANIINDKEMTSKTVMRGFSGFKVIDNALEFIKPYLEISNRGPAPFPGYMYRRKRIEGIELRYKDGGKYSDMTYLTRILKFGEIIWMAEPLMNYRLHLSNDTKNESIANRLSLMRYLYTEAGLEKKSNSASDMRFIFWSKWWIQSAKNGWLHLPKSQRERVILKFMMLKGLNLMLTRSYIWKRLALKMVKH